MASHGFYWSGVYGTSNIAAACIAAGNGGYGYNNAMTANAMPSMVDCNAYNNTSGAVNGTFLIGGVAIDTTDPGFVGGTPYDNTPQAALPTFEAWFRNVGSGANMIGPISPAGAGGGNGGGGGTGGFFWMS